MKIDSRSAEPPVLASAVLLCALLALPCSSTFGASLPRPPTDLQWRELGPPARAEHAAVLDSRHSRLVVFGGRTTWHEENLSNDVWVLHLGPEPSWERVDPEGIAPSPRFGCAAVFDPIGQRMLVFGGRDSAGLRNDLWELKLDGRLRWRRLDAAGTAPSPRYHHTATLDPEGGRLIVFGGWDGRRRNDLWELALTGPPRWAALAATGDPPGVRSSHTAVYAPDLGGILVFGGATDPYCEYCFYQGNDTWLLTLGAEPRWTDLTQRISGAPPCGIEAHSAIYDEEFSRMLIIDGYNDHGSPCWHVYPYGVHRKLWALSLGDMRWDELTPIGPQPSGRGLACAVPDDEHHRALFYGGTINSSGIWRNVSPDGDTWSLELGRDPYWLLVAPSGFAEEGILPPAGIVPSARIAAYDPDHDRLVVWGGNAVWAYPFGAHPAWKELAATGETPALRYRSAFAYDSRRNRIIVHGGAVSVTPGRDRLTAETWALSLTDPPAWSRIISPDPGPARIGGAAIYDPIRDRLIYFGGYDSLGGTSAETWSLALSGEPVWDRLLPLQPRLAPSMLHGRAGQSMVYEPRGDRVLMFGGGLPDADSWWVNNDIWELPLSGRPVWRCLDPGGPYVEPRRRARQALVLDPQANRLILFGGWEPGYFPHGPFDDAWQYDLENLRWSRFLPGTTALPNWMEPIAVVDTRRHRAVVTELDWLWALELGDERRAPQASHEVDSSPLWATSPQRLGLALLGPNPVGSACDVALSLPSSAPAMLELFDVAGRRVWSREFPSHGTGRVQVRLDCLAQQGAGVYLLRVAQGARSQTVRLVRIE